jgi:uncharacterized protein (TIGR02284 family)
MAEMTNEKKLVSLMNGLIELDYDAIEAYAAAIERLSTMSDKAQLEKFMEDHRRHVTDLSPLVQSFGAAPAASADYKKVLTKGKVVIAGLAGDEAVLSAMKSNEDTTNRAYEKATREDGVPMRIREVFERNLADEQRHRAWLESRISAGKAERPGVTRGV